MTTGRKSKVQGKMVDGKFVVGERYTSVSEKIRQKKSKRVKVVRRTP